MNKTDYLRKKGLIPPENFGFIYLVTTNEDNIEFEKGEIWQIGDEQERFDRNGQHKFESIKYRRYGYKIAEGIENLWWVTIDNETRIGKKEEVYLSQFAFLDEDNAKNYYEAQKLNLEKKLFFDKKNIKGTQNKLAFIQEKLEALQKHGFTYRNIMEELNKYNVSDPLPALIHKLMYACDNNLEEEIEYLTTIKNKIYSAPRG